jgi:triosephosphate isomerase
LTIAYEPVWSIGTGQTPSLTEIQDMHAFIRKVLREVNSETCAEHVRIIYGGSCNAENSKAIFALAEVDGGLIGGASMQLDSFMKILEAAC